VDAKLPSICVVTPVYNGARFLEGAITSVLEQRYPNLEYFVVDGGSTDGTLDIIRQHEAMLSGWSSGEDDGMYDAINRGFSQTTADVMCWLNADDVFLPSSLRQVGEMFQSLQEVDWLMANPLAMDVAGVVRSLKNPRSWSRYDVLAGNWRGIAQEATFWRRSLWERAGGQLNTSRRLAGDNDLWLRFFASGGQLHNALTVLGVFRRHDDQLSANVSDYEAEVAENYRALDIADEDLHRIQEIQELKERIAVASAAQVPLLSRQLVKLYEYPDRIVYSDATYSLQPSHRWSALADDTVDVIRQNRALRSQLNALRTQDDRR